MEALTFWSPDERSSRDSSLSEPWPCTTAQASKTGRTRHGQAPERSALLANEGIARNAHRRAWPYRALPSSTPCSGQRRSTHDTVRRCAQGQYRSRDQGTEGTSSECSSRGVYMLILKKAHGDWSIPPASVEPSCWMSRNAERGNSCKSMSGDRVSVRDACVATCFR